MKRRYRPRELCCDRRERDDRKVGSEYLGPHRTKQPFPAFTYPCIISPTPSPSLPRFLLFGYFRLFFGLVLSRFCHFYAAAGLYSVTPRPLVLLWSQAFLMRRRFWFLSSSFGSLFTFTLLFLRSMRLLPFISAPRWSFKVKSLSSVITSFLLSFGLGISRFWFWFLAWLVVVRGLLRAWVW